MDPVTTNRAILKFRSIDNNLIRLSIPRANTNLTTQAVQNIMADMLDIGIILTPNGSPHTKYSASLLSTTRKRLV